MTPAAEEPAATDGRTEVVLATVPGLGGLYARGLAASARHAARARLGRRRAAAPGVPAASAAASAAPAASAVPPARAARSVHAVPAVPAVAYVARGVTADADHLSAYQHLLGEPGTDALPAGFVHVLAFPVATALMVRPDFPLPLAGMVHLANTVVQHREVRLGEVLDVRAHVEALRGHRSGTQVDLVTEVAVAGEPVWRGVSTYLAKGVHLPGAASADGPTDARAAGPAGRPAGREPFVPPTPTARWSLPADVGRRYAAVSGDRNPIHLSALTARPLGFPRAIAHGMYTASRALAAVGPARGPSFTWTVRFVKPVLLPGEVCVRVAAAEDAAGFACAVWHRSGTWHLTGTVVPR